VALIIMIVVVAWILVPTGVGYYIGAEKGREGALWGFFLGWFGVLIVAILGPSPEKEKRLAEQQSSIYRECPHCKEQMRRDATVCPHCRIETDAWRLINGEWWRTQEDGFYVFDEATRGWTNAGAATSPMETPHRSGSTSWEEAERLAAERANAQAALVYAARAARVDQARERSEARLRNSKKAMVPIAVCVCVALAITVGAVLATRSHSSTAPRISAQQLQYRVAYDSCDGKTVAQLAQLPGGSAVPISGLTARGAISQIESEQWIPKDVAISFAGCWDAYRHVAPRYG
jgi:hypothetical protein